MIRCFTTGLFFFLVLAFAPAKGQYMQGTALGNYAGTNSLYHNPALVADSRYSVFANLAGFNYYVGNNHVKWNAPYSFLGFVTNSVSDEFRNENGKIVFPRRYLDQRLNGNIKYLNTGGEVRLPSLMISLKGGKYGLALSTRTRALMNLSQTSEPLARLIRGSTQDTTLHGEFFERQKGKIHIIKFLNNKKNSQVERCE